MLRKYSDTGNALAYANPGQTTTGCATEAAARRSLSDGPQVAPTLEPFHCEGDFWRLGYAQTTILVRHCRGLALLAYLIRHAGKRIHVRELQAVTPTGTTVPLCVRDEGLHAEQPAALGLGDAGPHLDARAKREYRRHVFALDVAIAEVERRHDLARAAVLRREREFVAAQLAAAVGLGGRDRRAASDVERMRVAITRRLRAAIRHVAILHPALGAHLGASVRTGFHCAYAPLESGVVAVRAAE